MKVPKIKKFIKVQINYKSGISKTFLCTEFTIKGKNLSWKSYGLHRPVDIAFNSVEDIESVWQLGFVRRIIWK